ncbi:MAG: 4Fe-4S double cluster binding domain-containing protein [Promethearchaeota archaeon]
MNTESKIIADFHEGLKAIGCKGRIVSGNHITDINAEIQGHRTNQLFNLEFYEEYKTFLETTPNTDFRINSIFIIAHPHPSTRVIFHYNQKELPLLIPPTYLQGREIIDKLRDFLTSILSPEGYNVAYARIPMKTLSVHSGLTQYGKNNITYVNHMGSFHRLSAYYSDFPLQQDSWSKHQMMDLCEKCSACIRNCPTGAIPTDRFLLRAEKCLTYHNEHPPEISFPEWIDSSWHNCLVGCLHCQKVCPANKKVISRIEIGPTFSEEETNLILQGKQLDQLPKLTIKKIKDYDLVEYLELFPRNLGAFLNKS